MTALNPFNFNRPSPVRALDSAGPLSCAVALLLLLVSINTEVAAQAQPQTESESEDSIPLPPEARTSRTPLSSDLVESRITEIETSQKVTQEDKTRLVERMRRILSDLEEAQTFLNTEAAYRAAVAEAPEQTASIRAELDVAKTAIPDPPVQLENPDDIAEIQRLLAGEQTQASVLETRLAQADKALSDADRQPETVRARITEANQTLSALDAEPTAKPDDDIPRIESEVHQWAQESRRRALVAEIRMLNQQIISADARRNLTRANADRDRAELDLLRSRRGYLEDQANRLRREQAEQADRETRAAAAQSVDAHQLVKDLVEENRQLSEHISQITEQLAKLDQKQSEAETRAQRIEREYSGARQRLQAAGLNRALGQMLIDQRNQLPGVRRLERTAKERETVIADSTLDQIRYNEELRRLQNADTYLDERLEGADADLRARIEPNLRKQMDLRENLLRSAIGIEQSYRRTLAEIDYAEHQLIKVVSDYKSFLAEHLLWVPSIAPITQQNFRTLLDGSDWLFDFKSWLAAGKHLFLEFLNSPLAWLLTTVALALLWKEYVLRRAVLRTAEPLRRVSTDSIGYTFRALALTLLAAAPWPMLLYIIGWLLEQSQADSFGKSIGASLMGIAPPLLWLRAFRLICIPGGLADRHFRWSSDVIRLLRSSFGWAARTLIPVGFVASAIYNYNDANFSGGLGRLSLVAFMLGFAAFTARVMHPSKGAMHNMLTEKPKGWANRLRHLWYPLLIAMPLALAGLALAGYLYTAGTLLRSLIDELWLVLAVVIGHQLIVRWLIVTRRSLALQAALERRANREAHRDEPDRANDLLTVPEEQVDLASLDAQTRRLLNTTVLIAVGLGALLIWSHVLPAFTILESFTLWSYAATVEGVKQQIPVTLADVGLLLVILFLAMVAAKNLPALLEILLLKYTNVSGGSRYTLTTLTGYVIVALGTLMVFGALGLSWSQIQWLVAALGVGIGFGLQEIVANFVSGLIILFERPVRVGDVVSVGDTTGVVTRIQIRATTIRNWDRQELLVPNKEMITGRLLNWSLSDQISRIVITVGADYGSDTKLAMQLLGEAAREQPKVMKDPAPVITFEGFGDNALTLILRCYIDNLEDRLSVTTQLHQSINDKLNAAGIGIAYPQRDVHLHTADPLQVRLHPTADAASATATKPAPAPAKSND